MSELPAFQCPYAGRGKQRCPEWRCDCFLDTYPDDPFGLHPEAFQVVWAEDREPILTDPAVRTVRRKTTRPVETRNLLDE